MAGRRATSLLTKKARFDTRLSQSQKELFEQAAQLKGYKSLSDFVIQVVQEAAQGIVDQHKTILASEKDRIVFFKALENPPAANTALKKAFRNYKRMAKGK